MIQLFWLIISMPDIVILEDILYESGKDKKICDGDILWSIITKKKGYQG